MAKARPIPLGSWHPLQRNNIISLEIRATEAKEKPPVFNRSHPCKDERSLALRKPIPMSPKVVLVKNSTHCCLCPSMFMTKSRFISMFPLPALFAMLVAGG